MIQIMAISFALGLGFCISHLWQDIKWLLASGGPLVNTLDSQKLQGSRCAHHRGTF